jgi:formylglycine-generating enzyme required for sulfatase activity
MKRSILLLALAALALITLSCSLPGNLLGGGSSGGAPTATPPGASSQEPVEPSAQDLSTRPVDGMEMIRIPAGEFLMGADDSAFAPERPGHNVRLDEYWIDRTEVTNAQYRECVESGACAEPKAWTKPEVSGDLQPVTVPWEAARSYCEWAGGRLPTEAEWEKAARGTDGRTWPWGNEFEANRANLSGPEDGYGPTAPVGSFPGDTSPYGVLDMAGNAAEWVSDWWDPQYYQKSPAQNPTGPAGGKEKVRRGIANAGGGPEKCRCAARYATNPDWEYGFRCVMPQSPEE